MQKNKAEGADSAISKVTIKVRRPYSAPSIISAENLEAAAAACEPLVPAPFGKHVACQALGS